MANEKIIIEISKKTKKMLDIEAEKRYINQAPQNRTASAERKLKRVLKKA